MTEPQPTRRPDPVAAANDEARTLAQTLLSGTGHGALSWIDPADGTPSISRVAFGLDEDGCPLVLVSGLAPHTAALRAHPDCALMVVEDTTRGDPMTHARLMLRARAEFVPQDQCAPLRAAWLARFPKAKVYIDLPDFAFVRLVPQSALLNGGFARAFRLAPSDLLAGLPG
ncbi:HugZ family protein [Fuscovulum blasticum]|uniref:HugZ family pyridoxamine 5'-phosphate oxidase n=1 Tax=Fuscovulum blasticum TaxID=1075 RepID=UPI000D3EBA05|nr:pyridoxamine 5'-phosphate oxidase family protein [Fuscovulum blasticum]AWD23363.1 pyridoxamine 5-phosphate oxidase [Fuscovulum blasticum]